MKTNVNNKKNYNKPELKVHGDLKKITNNSSQEGESDAIYYTN